MSEEEKTKITLADKYQQFKKWHDEFDRDSCVWIFVGSVIYGPLIICGFGVMFSAVFLIWWIVSLLHDILF